MYRNRGEPQYEFDSEDTVLSVYDITIGENNRPHKHEHVENGLNEFTMNWELVDTTPQIRGTMNIYLVDDKHYVGCRRCGVLREDNEICFSDGTPDGLVMCVVRSVFKGVLDRNSADISDGIDKDSFLDGDGLTVASPKELLLVQRCTQEEIDAYHDQMAELLYDVVAEYNKAETLNGIQNAVSDYRSQREELYSQYVDMGSD